MDSSFSVSLRLDDVGTTMPFHVMKEESTSSLQRTRLRSPLNAISLGAAMTQITRNVAALWLLGVVLCRCATKQAPWSPGENPNPSAILDEAKADATSGRYAEALAKHVWFFENALKYAPCMSGVRLSFALSDWKTLSDSYPPALEKLKAERDEAAAKVRASKDSRHSFNDFASINRELAEDAKTAELFLWLDASSPATASAVYDIAQPSLVKAKEYGVCGRYLDPDRSLERMVRLYTENKKIAGDAEFRREMSDFADKSLSNGVGTLVALLVVNGRTVEAKRVADGAMKVRDDSAFRVRIESALRGEVPPPWP